MWKCLSRAFELHLVSAVDLKMKVGLCGRREIRMKNNLAIQITVRCHDSCCRPDAESSAAFTWFSKRHIDP